MILGKNAAVEVVIRSRDSCYKIVGEISGPKNINSLMLLSIQVDERNS